MLWTAISRARQMAAGSLACALVFSGCGSSDAADSGGSGGSSGVDAGQDSSSEASAQPDVAQDPASEPMDLPDGTPDRRACTDSFGQGLTAKFGRLDGFLVSIVAPSSDHDCNADDEHIHLQILMKGAVYDVAVNVADSSSATTPVKFTELGAPALNGQWEEGWHTAGVSFDYVDDLHVHSPNFGALGMSELTKKIEDDLAAVNHISVYGTAYGEDGLHLVHKTYGGKDGAIVVRPLSAVPQVLGFCFADQGF